MTRYERQTFERIFDRDSAGEFCDFEFVRCFFRNCALSITRNPRLRSTVRNVKLVQCEQQAGTLHTAILRDVLVDGLKTNGLLQTWATVFDRVTLKGRVDDLMMSNAVAGGLASAEEQAAFDRANEEFYTAVDWALDIREAEFVRFDLKGVPAHLVKRDPETQVVVRRAKLLSGAWREVDLDGTYWPVTLRLFLERGDQDLVLVAPKRNKDFKLLVRGLQQLREAGVAEPN